MIDGAPKRIRLAVDLHEHLVQMPTPIRIRMALYAALPDLRSEHGTDPVPPETHRRMTDINTSSK
jgi:hypothetical protein